MAAISSTPTMMSIWAPGSSALGSLAASMSRGTWAQLTGISNGGVLVEGGAFGSMTGAINSMPWNPITKCIELIGGDHWGGPSGTANMRHVRYDAATNAFYEAQTYGCVMNGHGYDHTCVNPFTGDLYHRGYNSTVTYRKAVGASTFDSTTIPSWASIGGYVQAAIGTCWWTGPFTGRGGLGAQGGFAIFNSGATNGSVPRPEDGVIVMYDPLKNSWPFSSNSMAPGCAAGTGGAPGYTYQSSMEYSAVHNCAVYGGGNAAPHQVNRMNSDGSASSLPAVPSTTGLNDMGGGIMVAEPVTGNILFLNENNLWELNPTGSGTWTLLTGSRVPPSAISRSGDVNGTVLCSIPEFGVVAAIRQRGGPTVMYLYKHA